MTKPAIPTSMKAAFDNLEANKRVHTVPRGTNVQTTHAYFDLPEYIDTDVASHYCKARLLSNLCWNLDRRIITALRDTFYSIRDEQIEINGIDSYNELIAAVQTANFLDTAFPGSSEQASRLLDVHHLLELRLDVNDAAEKASVMAGLWRKHEVLELHEIIDNERPMKVADDSLSKMKKASTLAAAALAPEGDREILAAKLFATRKQRAQLRMESRHEVRQLANPALHVLLDFMAGMPPKDYRPISHFYELQADTQKYFLEGTIRSINGLPDQAMEDRDCTEHDFDILLAKSGDWINLLGAVLAAPRFHRGEAYLVIPQTEPPAPIPPAVAEPTTEGMSQDETTPAQ